MSSAGKRSEAQVSAIMRRVRSRDTVPEIAFKKAIRRAGLRFRAYDPRLPGTPDVCLPDNKLCVFVDGDYWHGHQWRRRGLTSLDEQLDGIRNAAYWRRKITGNIARDFRVTSELLAAGWQVIRFWESDLRSNMDGCVRMTLSATTEKTTKKTLRSPKRPKKAVAVPPAPLTAAEFFAGIGLVRLGLEPQWQVTYANDIDPQKKEMYDDNFGSDHFHLGDIHKIDPDDIPPTTLYTASFPCNDLSIAGAMNGLNGKESGAFWGLIDLLKAKKRRGQLPPLVLLENVVGFLQSHGGKDFETALLALNELGYACDAFILNAARWVPQSRLRLFVVAKHGVSGALIPSVETSEHRTEPLAEFINAHQNIAWDIRSLPKLPKRTSTLDDLIEDLPDSDEHWWSQERADYFMKQLSHRHEVTAKLMLGGRTYSYGTAFRRVRKGRSMAELRTDGIAGCLRTPRGGSGRQILLKAGRGKYKVRLLTARECARLQGVPDDYQINVPLNQALFGFGDAVCVPAIRWISEHYLIPVAAEMLRGRVLSA